MGYQVEIIPPSPIFKPFIEYYKNVVMDADGVFKCIPVTNQELYFNFKNIRLQSNGFYSLQNPHVFFTGLIQYEQDAYSFAGNDVAGGFVVVFKPFGIQNLFGISNPEFIGYAIDGENIFRNQSEYICHRLAETKDCFVRKEIVESFLHRFINNKFNPQPMLNRIIKLIKKEKGMLSPGMISKSFNISTRTLQRQFRDGIGMSPKEYLQITRLNHALKLIQGKNGYSLTRVSYLSGYYDQSHFIRDIKKICGFSPGTLKKETQHIEKCDNRNFLKLS